MLVSRPLLFASFVPLIFPDGDTTKKPLEDMYCELTQPELVKQVTTTCLNEYNSVNRSKQMDLVLFVSAIEHIVKIHRVITTEFGHALLVGVGGSGRKSLTELATFIASYEMFQIEMAKDYNMTTWREDMKDTLFLQCGIESKTTVFLFSDTQIINEAFVEDINNILNNGEIPNLYSAIEDITNIQESMKEVNK
jgi:dynein heavy chain